MKNLIILLVSVGSTLVSSSAVPQSNDEQLLTETEQHLAKAWSQHDRAFIESVLAPEWSVTQADGSVLTRSTVLGPFFDAVVFESSVIDDVTVKVFGETAVVRGRTVARAKLNGAPVSARIRFTDVFIKRKGRWQVVASHASPLASGTQSAAAAFHLLFDEALTKRKAAATDAALAPAFIFHGRGQSVTLSPADALKMSQPILTAFPDVAFSVDDVIDSGERAAARISFTGTHQGAWRDILPTGRRVAVTEMFFCRTTDGKLAECWQEWDEQGLLQQLTEKR